MIALSNVTGSPSFFASERRYIDPSVQPIGICPIISGINHCTCIDPLPRALCVHDHTSIPLWAFITLHELCPHSLLTAFVFHPNRTDWAFAFADMGSLCSKSRHTDPQETDTRPMANILLCQTTPFGGQKPGTSGTTQIADRFPNARIEEEGQGVYAKELHRELHSGTLK